MISYIQTLIGGSSEPSKPTTQQSLPASWYSSPELYELERRAIFSKSWLLITHKNRLLVAGDCLQYTQAGHSFFICLDRKGSIGAFHNICRHRGFPLVHEDVGNVKILACQYHGWSYGLDGKLAKAPYFDDISDFDKSKNGLFPIHVHIDQLGFIWANFEASEAPTVAWHEQFPDQQTRFEPFDFSEYTFDHTWVQEAKCNWKTLADNYNECLHCRVAHPDTRGLLDLHSYNVEGNKGSLQHFNKKQVDGLVEAKNSVASAYFFPNACMTVSPHFMYYMRCVPTSATTCSMQYEVHRHRNASDEEFEHINQFFKRVLAEDKWLCNLTQSNLNAGIYANGQLHPNHEQGPLYFQSLVKNAVKNHRQTEQKLGREIWPASQRPTGSSTSEDQEFCSGLTCGSANQSLLNW